MNVFAQMASDTIACPKAYENIMECLPESYKMFKEILKEMLSKELEWLRNLF